MKEIKEKYFSLLETLLEKINKKKMKWNEMKRKENIPFYLFSF